MIIYRIVNKITGLSYVGQTIVSMKKRWSDHTTKKSCPYLAAAIKKYGKENFSIDILGTYDTLQALNDAEEYFVDYYNCIAPNGYNLKAGGGSYGKHSEMSKQKMMGRPRNKGFLGRLHSKKTKQQIAASLTGQKRKPISNEIKEKIRLGLSRYFTNKKVNQNT